MPLRLDHVQLYSLLRLQCETCYVCIFLIRFYLTVEAAAGAKSRASYRIEAYRLPQPAVNVVEGALPVASVF